MKSKTYRLSVVAMVIAIIGAIAFVLRQEEMPGSHLGDPNSEQDRLIDDRQRRTQPVEPRVRRRPNFESVDEAEQALLDFDLSAVMGSDPEEAERCFYRLRNLVSDIPEDYYSQLASSFGRDAKNKLDHLFLQMAIFQEWGRKDLESAFADLSNVPDERLFQKALHSVFVGAMDAGAADAMKLAETIDIEPGGFGDFERIDLLDTVYDIWIESDSFSALEWAKESSVPDKRRDQWIADGLRAWTKKDPEAAERWRERENFEGFKP